MSNAIHFDFLTKSMSAYDAWLLVRDAARWRREYQLAATGADPNHETAFGWGSWEDEVNPNPGEPTSPPIASVDLTPSGLYVEFRFLDSPMYMTVPATSTITLGWMERVTHE